MGFITIFHDGGNDDKGDQYRVISRRGTFHRPPKTPASKTPGRKRPLQQCRLWHAVFMAGQPTPP